MNDEAKPETDRYTPDEARVSDPIEPVATSASANEDDGPFDPLSTIEDAGLMTRTVLRAVEAPALARPGPEPNGGRRADRYAIDRRVGATKGGQAFVGHDATLDRGILIKILPASKALDPLRRGRFFREARMGARLHHPNILPVYDLDQTDSGDLYFTAAAGTGRTLLDCLRERAAGGTAEAIATWRHAVSILIRVAEGLGHAHGRGIVHRDLKPEHIILFPEGEVQVGGWQWAAELDPATAAAPPGLVGTPAYMAPEQARGEAADPRSDVYALGAILAELICGELPVVHPDEETFWTLKRNGGDLTSYADRHRDAPRHLLACVLRALSVQMDQRPADGAALAHELHEAFDAQVAETLTSGQRQGRLQLILAGVLVAATLALVVLAPDLKKAWQRPSLIVSEDFSSSTWHADLRVLRPLPGNGGKELSDFRLENGDLVSSGLFHNYLFLDRMLTGRVEVDMEALLPPEVIPGEISVVWVPNDPFLTDTPLAGSAYLQVGAWDNEYTSIFLNTWGDKLGGARADIAAFRLRPGKVHDLRFIIDGGLFEIYADSELMCSYRDPSAPQRSGWLGLYAVRHGKVIRSINVRAEVNALVPVTAVAEAHLAAQRFPEAVAEYDRVLRSLDGATAEEAIFRKGMALARMGSLDSARATWQTLTTSPWIEMGTIQAIEADFLEGRHAEVLSAIRSLYQASEASRPLLHVAWSRFLFRTADRREAPFDEYLRLITDLFQDDLVVRHAAALSLNRIGRHEEVVKNFVDQRTEAAIALLALGREADLIDRFPDRVEQVQRAQLNLGRLQEVSQGIDGPDRQLALVLRGKAEEVLNQPVFPNSWIPRLALTCLGRFDDLSSEGAFAEDPFTLIPRMADGDFSGDPGPRRSYMLRTAFLLRGGRSAELSEQDRESRMAVSWGLVDALARGDGVAATSLRQRLDAFAIPAQIEATGWMLPLIILPILDTLAGDADALPRAKATIAAEYRNRWGGMAWHLMMNIDGSVTDAVFAAQPVQVYVPALTALRDALRAELAGRPEEATAAWKAYLDLPYGQRTWGQLAGDPAIDHLAAWRIDLHRRVRIAD